MLGDVVRCVRNAVREWERHERAMLLTSLPPSTPATPSTPSTPKPTRVSDKKPLSTCQAQQTKNVKQKEEDLSDMIRELRAGRTVHNVGAPLQLLCSPSIQIQDEKENSDPVTHMLSPSQFEQVEC